MAFPALAAVMKQRSAQAVQARGMRAGAELTRLAKWGLPAGAAGESSSLFVLLFVMLLLLS